MEWSRHTVWPLACPESLGTPTFSSEMEDWKESVTSQYVPGNLKVIPHVF